MSPFILCKAIDSVCSATCVGKDLDRSAEMGSRDAGKGVQVTEDSGEPSPIDGWCRVGAAAAWPLPRSCVGSGVGIHIADPKPQAGHTCILLCVL